MERAQGIASKVLLVAPIGMQNEMGKTDKKKTLVADENGKKKTTRRIESWREKKKGAM